MAFICDFYQYHIWYSYEAIVDRILYSFSLDHKLNITLGDFRIDNLYNHTLSHLH